MDNLLNKHKFQVFLFSCPANIPFTFFTHNWFVVNNKGDVSRWELLIEKNICKTSWNHLHKDAFQPFSGIGYFAFLPKFLSRKSKLLAVIEGDKDSIAAKMTKFILESPDNYPYSSFYFPTGPNSNTYIQWVLNRFPNSGLSLEKKAIGKDF